MPDTSTQTTALPLSEVLASFSYALDITEGQPAGHCIRSCWIGTHIGLAVGLDGQELADLYYTLLLKDLGCSSNASRIAELYLTDDRSFKHDFKTIGAGVSSAFQFVLDQTGRNSDMVKRLKAIGHIMKHGGQITNELIETRCTRGAAIARQMRFSEKVASGIHSLDEHWDGSGHPQGLQGQAIPLYSRIALLSQDIDVFNRSRGPDAAVNEVISRSDRWFDPGLVNAFLSLARSEDFWAGLASNDLEQRVLAMTPAQARIMIDEDWMDDIAAAFGQVIDAKSPYTSGHSERVGDYAEMIGRRLGVDKSRLRWLKRAACLHDVGKLGVSSSILDKPGSLEDEEWVQMRDHATQSHAILSRISAFGDLAAAAASHHERLDGTGYPHGLSGDQISLETRIITIADFYDALTADRPYRAAMSVDQSLSIISKEIGKAVDADCYVALVSALGERGENLPGADLIRFNRAV